VKRAETPPGFRSSCGAFSGIDIMKPILELSFVDTTYAKELK